MSMDKLTDKELAHIRTLITDEEILYLEKCIFDPSLRNTIDWVKLCAKISPAFGAPRSKEETDSPIQKYSVTVTGTWNIDVEADSPEEAENIAYAECVANGMDVELMNLEFEAYNEEDEL